MKAGIYFNRRYITDNLPHIERITNVLRKHGHECVVVENLGDVKTLDMLFVLGGDGTILTVAAECAKYGVKILGINYGHLGFLAEFEPERIDEAAELVCGGNYATVRRSMLEITCGENKWIALNDLVIQRSTCGKDFSNTVEIRAAIDGSTVDNFSSDGIIISTPTGSTAYSLSAGGSILTPDINAFIMTPVCAHSLHSRPVVYNDNSVLEIIPLSARNALNIIVDGKFVGVIEKDKTVKVIKSSHYVNFITRNSNDFFNKLLIKLNIWSK